MFLQDVRRVWCEREREREGGHSCELQARWFQKRDEPRHDRMPKHRENGVVNRYKVSCPAVCVELFDLMIAFCAVVSLSTPSCKQLLSSD